MDTFVDYTALLYWIVLKKGITIDEWADKMEDHLIYNAPSIARTYNIIKKYSIRESIINEAKKKNESNKGNGSSGS